MEHALKKVIDISKNLNDYNDKIKNINAYIIKSTSQMCLEYKDMYKNTKDTSISIEAIENLCHLFAKNNELATLLKEQLTDDIKLKWNSRRWRMVQDIRTPKIIRFARKVLTR